MYVMSRDDRSTYDLSINSLPLGEVVDIWLFLDLVKRVKKRWNGPCNISSFCPRSTAFSRRFLQQKH